MKQLRSFRLLVGALFLLVGSSSLHAGVIFTNIFSFNGTNGSLPTVLVRAGNNKFYGVTQYGGPNYAGSLSEYGSIYSITTDGVFSNLYFFENTNGNTGFDLTPGLDGSFYGTTEDTIFKLNPDGTMANPHLADFAAGSLYLPFGMLQDRDGTIYGTTRFSGSSGYGSIYKIDTNGVFSTLVTFNGTNGAQPVSLLLGADNSFYGLAQEGGNSFNGNSGGDGLIFRVDRSGNLTTVYNFSNSNGFANCLVQGFDGDLYGVSYVYDYGLPGINPGSVFRITTNGDLVWSFSFNGTNGFGATWITAGNDGNLYGLTSWGAIGYDGTANSGHGTIFRITPNGSFTSLFQFDGTNDSGPGTIIQGTDGNLYGTCGGGGTYGQGAIFKLTLPTCPTNGLMETLVVNFTSGANGELNLGDDGLLYGESGAGGDFGLGTIYKCTLDGSLTQLASFNGTNGAFPAMPLVPMPDGSFYGVAQYGGNGFNGSSVSGLGTIFKLSSSGDLNAVVSFRGTNGANPITLIPGSDGNLYGATYFGGAFTNDPSNSYQGDGTVFKLSTNGQFTLLGSFEGANGEAPFRMIQANDGNFYGVTGYGGEYGNGTVFQMTPDGSVTTLFSFNGTNGDGPITLIQGSDGFLYGTTDSGGPGFNGTGGSGDGTAFRISTNGGFTSLASFNVNTTGRLPFGRLLEVCNGVFYGTTGFGGAVSGDLENGTLFRITTNGNLTALVTFLPSLELPDHPGGGVIKAFDGNFYGVGAEGLYCIRPIQSPVLQSCLQGNQINISWNAWAGYRYDLLSRTNVADTNLFHVNDLFQTIAATNGPMSVSDTIGPDSQRFYELILNQVQ